ncbi:MAG: hypothetical protein OXH90_07570 [Paracoccaceae bacterium]|nr:hypothetical protein [Paracoccaceae bacterium]MDE2916411.1 hypothetical protein [Paracoccaceae bacterium]
MQEKIDNKLKKIVQEQLEPATIVRLQSEKAEDHDGDPIMRIRVVYEAENNRLDPNKALGLSRILSEKLSKIFTERYPVFYFLTQEEDAIVSR